MRTIEAEEREVQERTWIYLLHDQAPPTAARHVTPAVLAARSAGVLGGDAAPSPLLPSVFASLQPQPPSQTPYATSQFAPAAAPTSFHGVDEYGRPLAAARNGNAYPLPYGATAYAPRVVTAHDKWRAAPQAPAPQVPSQQQQQQQLAPLRSILMKSEKTPVYVPVVVPGPMVMKRDPTQQVQQAASSAVVVPAQKKKSSTSLAGLLPKKRRHDEMNEQYSAEAAAAEGDDADEDEESKLAKRNCFPKKCDFPMCKNSSRSRGFCYSHGGGRRCRMDGCNNGAVSRDLCKRHGGGRRCRISGCKSSSESGGLCYSHGGGRRCSLSWCSARAKKGGYCAVHIDNKNAAAPSPEELAALSEAQQQTHQQEATKAVVPPNVVETLLSLAQAKSAASTEVAARSSSPVPTAGSVSPTSPTLPELSTPRFSSIASLLN